MVHRMTTMTLKCRRCEQPFFGRSDRPAKFCSMACRRDQVTKECEECGTVFTRKRSLAGPYCSRGCSDKNSKGRPRDESKYVTKNCPGCHQDFEVPTWRDVEHCSRECRTKATLIHANCPECAKPFTYYRSWPRIHCSQACYGASRDQGGPIYYGGNWAVQRALAIVRDGGCVDCRATEDLHVHHILSRRSFGDDWRSANELSNLETVCPPHHLARHGGHYHALSLPGR